MSDNEKKEDSLAVSGALLELAWIIFILWAVVYLLVAKSDLKDSIKGLSNRVYRLEHKEK